MKKALWLVASCAAGFMLAVVLVDAKPSRSATALNLGRVMATCDDTDQMNRIETLVRAILVTQDGATFGKPGWNGLSAFVEVRKEKRSNPLFPRQQDGYLDPEPLP